LWDSEESMSPDVVHAKDWLAANYDSVEFFGRDVEKYMRVKTVTGLGAIAIRWLPGPGTLLGLGIGAAFWMSERRELLRLLRSNYWERNDPLTYLAPGASQTVKTEYQAGLSATLSGELVATVSASAALEAKLLVGSLKHEVGASASVRLAAALTGTVSHSVSRSSTLANPSGNRRIYAVWRPKTTIRVQRLVLVDDRLSWQGLGEYDFYAAGGCATTFFETVSPSPLPASESAVGNRIPSPGERLAEFMRQIRRPRGWSRASGASST
jgi:hypothetical protein